jgi:hypothetical protein
MDGQLAGVAPSCLRGLEPVAQIAQCQIVAAAKRSGIPAGEQVILLLIPALQGAIWVFP